MKIAIYNIYFAVMGGGERRTALLAAHLAKSNDVTLFVHTPLSKELVMNIFGIDLSGVTIEPLGDKDPFAEICKMRPDVFINNTHGSTLANVAPAGIYMCMFPRAETMDLSSYHAITANSAFTAEWILKKWGYQSEIVYSACQFMGPGSQKKNVILNVARFFENAPTVHYKNQDVLIDAFRKLVGLKQAPWELHLVGYTGGWAQDKAFVERLKLAGEGYPIRILQDIDFDSLRQEYRQASIYWHATGYGYDATSEPSRQEHFGMSIVEAMSAGAIPLAFNGGGPRETIKSGISGYLWDHVDDLVDQTRGLIADSGRRQVMSAMAAEDSRHFLADRYLSRMDAIIARLTARSHDGAVGSRMPLSQDEAIVNSGGNSTRN